MSWAEAADLYRRLRAGDQVAMEELYRLIVALRALAGDRVSSGEWEDYLHDAFMALIDAVTPCRRSCWNLWRRHQIGGGVHPGRAEVLPPGATKQSAPASGAKRSGVTAADPKESLAPLAALLHENAGEVERMNETVRFLLQHLRRRCLAPRPPISIAASGRAIRGRYFTA